jgi:hypothetical protein
VVMDKGEPKDRQDMKAILDSFEVTNPK